MSQLYVDNIKNRTGGAIGAPAGIVVSGVGTFSGNVSIGGTLSYEDVTNIDSVGIITARSDISIADKIIHTGDTNTAIRFPASDTFSVETAGSERLRIDSGGALQVGASATVNIKIIPNTGLVVNDGGIDCYQATTNSATIPFKLQSDVGGTKVVKASITAGGIISDSIGPLRRLGIQAASGSFSLADDMVGKLIRSTGSGAALTLNQNIFTAGDMISVFNVSGGNNTIVQGTGVTLYNTADAATGTRTIAAKGMVTIVCTASNEFAISGSQLT